MGYTDLGIPDTRRDWPRHLYDLLCTAASFISGASLTVRNTVYRTNTFPLIHAGFFHALLNVVALTPLLERFETEHGTLTSLLLFFGREFGKPWPATKADTS